MKAIAMTPARLGLRANLSQQTFGSRINSWLMNDANVGTMFVTLLILGGVAIGVSI